LFDFISVGTNDLMQFMFAADRSNLNASGRYDTLNVAFLKALNYIQQVCRTAHVPCSVCGEMAGRSIEALALIGLGYTSLSMNPRSLLRVKTALRGINKEELQNYLERLLKTEHLSIRTQLQSYLRDHGVVF
jgi:phosphotransferase system enzyme I (PtsP)